MTCYFRHLEPIFKKAGIKVTSENKQKVDMVVHSIVGVDYKNCPTAWKEVKKRMAEDEDGLISELKQAWKRQA